MGVGTGDNYTDIHCTPGNKESLIQNREKKKSGKMKTNNYYPSTGKEKIYNERNNRMGNRKKEKWISDNICDEKKRRSEATNENGKNSYRNKMVKSENHNTTQITLKP